MKWKHSSTDPRYLRTYQAWNNMRKRCLNPNHPKYPIYGARGISICQRWINDFDAFITDMGIAPPGLTLEREDNSQGYDPFNCIWASMKAQAFNTRKAIARRERRALDLEAIAQRRQDREKVKAERLASKPVYIPQSPVHGSRKMYFKHKCRCVICVEAFRARLRKKPRAIQGTPQNQKKKDYLKHYRLRKKLEYDL